MNHVRKVAVTAARSASYKSRRRLSAAADSALDGVGRSAAARDGRVWSEPLEPRMLLSLSTAVAVYQNAANVVAQQAPGIVNDVFGSTLRIPLLDDADDALGTGLNLVKDLQNGLANIGSWTGLAGPGNGLPAGFVVTVPYTASGVPSGPNAGDLFLLTYSTSFTTTAVLSTSGQTGFPYLDNGNVFGAVTANTPTVTVVLNLGVDGSDTSPQFFISTGPGATGSNIAVTNFSANGSIGGIVDIGELGNVSVGGTAGISLNQASLSITDPRNDTKARVGDFSTISSAVTGSVSGNVTITPSLTANLSFLPSFTWNPSFSGSFGSAGGWSIGQINLNAPSASSILASLGQGFLSLGEQFLAGGSGSAVLGPLSFLNQPLPLLGESVAQLSGLDADLPQFPSFGTLSPGNVLNQLYSWGFKVDDQPTAAAAQTQLPSMIGNLIDGDHVDLISWSISGNFPLKDFSYQVPIYGFDLAGVVSAGLFAKFGVNADLYYNLGFGLDTHGFYLNTGPLLGVTFGASAGIEGEVSVFGFDIASAGGDVGVSISPAVTLTAPSWDTGGRVYTSDLALFGSNPAADLVDALGVDLKADFTGDLYASVELLFWSVSWHWNVDVPIFDIHDDPTWPAENPNQISGGSGSHNDWTNLTENGATAASGMNVAGGTLTFNAGPSVNDIVKLVQGANNSLTVDWLGGAGSENEIGGSETFQNVGQFVFNGSSGSDELIAASGLTIPINATSNSNSSSGTLIVAGNGNNTLKGGSGGDTLIGGSGNDSITGGSGKTVILGNDGNDTITAGSGNTQIATGAGSSLVTGGSGADTIDAGSGNNTLNGGSGAYVINAGSGNDTIFGGSTTTTITGGVAPVIIAGSGNDVVFGGNVPTVINGGTGSDTIYGGSGFDTISGGSGGNNLIVGAALSWEQQSAGTTSGISTITLTSGSVAGLFIRESVAGPGIAPGTVISNLSSGSGVVTLSNPATATSFSALLTFGGNNIYGGGTGDTLIGGMGNNTVTAGSGNETVYGGLGGPANPTTYGGAAGDASLNNLGTGINYTNGSPVSTGDNLLLGGSGNDVMIADSGGTNTLQGGTGNDTLYAGPAGDYLAAGTGVDALYGGPGNDSLQPQFDIPQTPTGATESGVVVTLSSAGTFSVGQTISVTGITPAGYNGTFVVTSVGIGYVTYTDPITGLAAATTSGGSVIATSQDTLDGGAGLNTLVITPSTANALPGAEPLVKSISNTSSSITVSTPNNTPAGQIFQTGQLIQIDNEKMLVTGVNGNVLTVQRAQNGTSAAYHSAFVDPGSLLDPIGLTDATITVSNAATFTAGTLPAVIQIDGEQMLVTAAPTYNISGSILAGGSASFTAGSLVVSGSGGAATLSAANSFVAGQTVNVAGTGTAFDGTYLITGANATSFSYSIANYNASGTAVGIGVETLSGTATTNSVIVNMTGGSAVAVGDQITGPGIQSGTNTTTVITGVYGSTISLSLPATGAGSTAAFLVTGNLTVQRAFGYNANTGMGAAANHSAGTTIVPTPGAVVQIIGSQQTSTAAPSYYIGFTQTAANQFQATLYPLNGSAAGSTLLGQMTIDVPADVQEVAIQGGIGNNVIKVDPSVTRNMFLYGGPGNNTLYGGSGNDTLVAGPGNAVLYGGSNNSVLYGGDLPSQDQQPILASNQQLSSQNPVEGDDTLIAGGGSDELYAGSGNDVLIGGNASLPNPGLNASASNFFVLGKTSGSDTLVGGSGIDLMIAGPGSPSAVMFAGTGNDTLAGANAGRDVLEGSSGITVTATAVGNTLTFAPSASTSGIFTQDAVSGTGVQLGTTVTGVNSATNTITAVSLTNNVATIYAANSYASGQYVTVSGVSNAEFDGQFQILSANTSSFSYSLVDPNFTLANQSGASAIQTLVTLSVPVSQTITNSVFTFDGNDLILGDNLTNDIIGGAGNDTLVGGTGVDYIQAGTTGTGTGNQTLYGAGDNTGWTTAINAASANFVVLTLPANPYNVYTGASVVRGSATVSGFISTSAMYVGEPIYTSNDADIPATGKNNKPVTITAILSNSTINISQPAAGNSPAGTGDTVKLGNPLQEFEQLQDQDDALAAQIELLYAIPNPTSTEQSQLIELLNEKSFVAQEQIGIDALLGATQAVDTLIGNGGNDTFYAGTGVTSMGSAQGIQSAAYGSYTFYNYQPGDTITGGNGGGNILVLQETGSVNLNAAGGSVVVTLNGGNGTSANQFGMGNPAGSTFTITGLNNVQTIEVQTLGTGGSTYLVTTTAGSNVISGLPANGNYYVGQSVVGAGIPVGATIIGFPANGSATLSQPATASSLVAGLTFAADTVTVVGQSINTYGLKVQLGTGNDLVSAPQFTNHETITGGTGVDVMQIAANAASSDLITGGGKGELDLFGSSNFNLSNGQLITNSVPLPFNPTGFARIVAVGSNGSNDTFTSDASSLPSGVTLVFEGGSETGTTNTFTAQGGTVTLIGGDNAANNFNVAGSGSYTVIGGKGIAPAYNFPGTSAPVPTGTTLDTNTATLAGGARSGLAATSVGTVAIFAGGYGASGYSNAVDLYDSATGAWSTTTLRGGARYYLAATTVGTQAIFAGGQGSNGETDAVDIYNSSSGQWSTSNLIGGARYVLAATTVGTEAIFAGGYGPSGYSAAVNIFNSSTGTWSTTTLPGGPRDELAATTVGTLAIFAGGYGPNGFSNAVDIYDSATGRWSTTNLSGGARYDLVATTVGTKAIFAGGVIATGNSGAVDVYDASTGQWTTSTLPSGARFHLSATAVGTKALFAGGAGNATGTGPDNYTNAVDIFDAGTDQWSTATIPSGATAIQAATTVGTLALFAGGLVVSSGSEVYSNTVDILSLPGISAVTLPTAAAGEIPVTYTLSSELSLACTLTAQFSVNGGPWQAMTTGAGGDGTTGLSSSATGTRHTIVWDSQHDLGNTTDPSVAVRFVAVDSNGAVSPVAQFGPVAVNNAGAINTLTIQVNASNALLNLNQSGSAVSFSGGGMAGTASNLTGLTVQTVSGATNDSLNASGLQMAVTLIGGPGSDSLYGGAGNDTLIPGSESGTYNGGGGASNLIILNQSAGVTSLPANMSNVEFYQNLGSGTQSPVALSPIQPLIASLTNFVQFPDGADPVDGLLQIGNTFYFTTYTGGAFGDGAVVSVPITGGTPTVLGSFNGYNGNISEGSLIVSGNTLYGTAAYGGANGDGDVFSVPLTGGNITVVGSFNANDGQTPVAGLTLVSGYLYGTTYRGGAGYGVVFSVPISGGTPSILASFNSANGSNPQSGLVFDNGYLYGTTYGGGGGANDGTVFAVTVSTGAIRVVGSFNGSDGAYPYSTPVVVGNALYGTTYSGGTNNSGTVYTVLISGGTPTAMASFSGRNGLNPFAGVTLYGNILYGTTISGGLNNDGAVYSIPLNGSSLTLLTSFNGSNGQALWGGVTVYGNTLYGTAADGSQDTAGDVFSVQLTGGDPTILSTFPSRPADSQGGFVISGSTLYGTTYGGGDYGGNGGDGTVFSIPVGGGKPTVLASFNGIDGANPRGALTLVNGSLIGTTEYGGANNSGTVFSIPVSGGPLTTLASFHGNDGSNPYAGVILINSTLYGTTDDGGPDGLGVVYSLPLVGGTPTVLAYFNQTDGAYADGGLIASNGVLYGTTNEGGSGGPTVYSVPISGAAGGAPTVLAYFNGDDGNYPTSTLLLVNGILYGTAIAGGPSKDGTIFSVPIGGGTLTLLASFNGSNGAAPEGGLVLSGSTLYGATLDGGGPANDGVLYSLPLAGGSPSVLATFNGSNGANPYAVPILSGNTLYGATEAGGTANAGVAYAISIPPNTLTASTVVTQSGVVTTVTVTFIDNNVGAQNQDTASINWGDNNTSTGIITAGNGYYTITASHIYQNFGTYNISATVIDSAGAAAVANVSFTGGLNLSSGTLYTYNGSTPTVLDADVSGYFVREASPMQVFVLHASGQLTTDINGTPAVTSGFTGVSKMALGADNNLWFLEGTNLFYATGGSLNFNAYDSATSQLLSDSNGTLYKVDSGGVLSALTAADTAWSQVTSLPNVRSISVTVDGSAVDVLETDGDYWRFDGTTATLIAEPHFVFSLGGAACTATNPGSATAGNSSTAITVTAEDLFGNVATGYVGTVSFLSSDPAANLPSGYTISATDAGSHVFDLTFKTETPPAVGQATPGTQTLTVTDGESPLPVSGSATVTVNPAAVVGFTVVPVVTTATAGSAFGVTVTAVDSYGNPVNNYTGTVNFNSSDSAASNGSANISSASEIGSVVTVTTASPDGLKAGGLVVISGVGITSYNGVFTVASVLGTGSFTYFDPINGLSVAGGSNVSGASAGGGLPGGYRFTGAGGDNGSHVFPLTLITEGGQTITITDGAGLTGTGGVGILPGAFNASMSTITAGPAGVAPGAVATTTLVARDKFGNPLQTGGLAVLFEVQSGTGGYVAQLPDPNNPGNYVSFIDNGNGTYTGAFDAYNNASPGVVALTALVNNQQIGGTASLAISGATNLSGQPSYYLRMDAGQQQVDVWYGSTATGTAVLTLPTSQLGTLNVSGGTVILDESAGNLIPTGGINVTGASNLELIGTSGFDTLNASAGVLNFDGGTINYTGTPAVQFDPNGGDDAVTVTGGQLTITAGPAGGGIVTRQFSSVSIGPSATLLVSSPVNHSDRSLLVVSSLSIAGTAGAWSGTLNLGGNDLDVVGGNLATLTNQLASGSAFGTWTGRGIDSAAAAGDLRHLTVLGVIANSNGSGPIYGNGPVANRFDGYNPAAADVLVKYTFYGDANLDGRVDGSDYTKVDTGYVSNGLGWAGGDFNYDGTVDGSDYSLIDNAFNNQGLVFGGAPAAVAAAELDSASSADAAGASTAAIERRIDPVTAPAVRVFSSETDKKDARATTAKLVVVEITLPAQKTSPIFSSQTITSDAYRTESKLTAHRGVKKQPQPAADLPFPDAILVSRLG